MSIINTKFNPRIPLPDIFPKEWADSLGKSDNIIFNNLHQFKFIVSQLTQKYDKKCGMSYADALDMLIKNKSDFHKTEQETIRNLVRSNLLKRGLITEEVYENYKYTTDGVQVGVDVGKYASGDPECVMTPNKKYIDFFYELYISISYHCEITNKEVRENVAKLLATVEELERQRIFIKVNVVFPGIACGSTNDANFFSSIPLFSHKEFKDVDVMSSVVNDRLLRKFYFAILEDFYGNDLDDHYGTAIQLPKTLNIGNSFDEIDFFTEIKDTVEELP